MRAACYASLNYDKRIYGKSNMKMRKQKHGGSRKGAGRPATGQTPMRGVRMSDSLYKQIIAWGREQAVPMGFAAAARKLLEFALSRRSKNS